MGRYLGPVCRLCRREGVKLYLKGERCLSGKCAFSKKKKAPGMAKGRKGKVSNYGLQLREKQKVKRYYYVSEGQFRKYFDIATTVQGNTGDLLLQFLERRLDNVVYRLGLASSRKQARQMVNHGYVLLNDAKATIASMQVSKGDVIRVKDAKKDLAIIQENVKRDHALPNWLEKIDDTSGKVMELPAREAITDIPIKEQMIIELYSK